MASFFVCYNYFYYNVLFSGNQTKGSKLSGASVFVRFIRFYYNEIWETRLVQSAKLPLDLYRESARYDAILETVSIGDISQSTLFRIGQHIAVMYFRHRSSGWLEFVTETREEFLNRQVHWIATAVVRPKASLCGEEDVTIQLLSSCKMFKSSKVAEPLTDWVMLLDVVLLDVDINLTLPSHWIVTSYNS